MNAVLHDFGRKLVRYRRFHQKIPGLIGTHRRCLHGGTKNGFNPFLFHRLVLVFTDADASLFRPDNIGANALVFSFSGIEK